MPRSASLGYRRARRLAAALAGVWLLSSPAPLQAAGVVGSGTPGSCGQAALAAALTGGGEVSFDCGADEHTIVLTTPQVLAADTAIDGGTRIRLSGGNSTRLFVVNGGVEATLANLTLSNGFAGGDGGAIVNNGDLAIINCAFRNNQTVATASGGAIVSYGPLFVIDSRFEDNQAGNGGAFYLRFPAAVVEVLTSVLRGNRATNTADSGWGGAALVWDGASLTLHGSEVSDNTAPNAGGALYNTANSRLTIENGADIRDNGGDALPFGGGIANFGTLEITNASVRNNTARSGGGIRNQAAMTLRESTISGNRAVDGHGGGIDNRGGGTLYGVTLSGNSAVRGGAIAHEAGLLALVNVTITANATTAEGAGILSDTGGDMTVTHSTIAGNDGPRGAALARAGGGAVRLRNVLLANSGAEGNCYLAGSSSTPPISDGFNMATDATCSLGLPSDFPDRDPLVVLPAGDHGGATRTILLAAASPAIDAGQCLPSVPLDQRQVVRPQGAACEIGAVEMRAADIASPTPSPSATPTAVQTATTTPALTATPTRGVNGGCPGDCDGDGSVAINELISGVNIALGNAALATCPAADSGLDPDGAVSVSDLIRAVNNTLLGCPR